MLVIGAVLTINSLQAQTVTIEIRGIRGDKGQILAMAQGGKDSKPVYGMAKPEKGMVMIKLEHVTWDQFEVSVFHDENDNRTMDLNEDKMPIEGYARKSCKLENGEATCKLKLYYPVNQ